MNELHSSDPLPYVQVDRAVKPKAAILAGALNVSPQHALGSLVEFWELCGDPREIEKLIEAGQEEVVLSRDEVVARFELASGKPMEPEKMVRIGLLEPRGELFRVRGMSRFFAPVKSRLQRRAAARLAGHASAKARAEKLGTAQPTKATPVLEAGCEGVRDPVRQPVRTTFENRSGDVREPFNDSRSENQPNGQRTADNGHLLKEEDATSSSDRPVPLPKKPDDPHASGDAWFAHIQHLRIEHGFITEKYPKGGMSWFWNEVGLELNGDFDRLDQAYERFTENKHWENSNPPWPMQAFMKDWRSYVRRKNLAG